MPYPKLEIERRLDRIEKAIEALAEFIQDVNPNFNAAEIKRILKED